MNRLATVSCGTLRYLDDRAHNVRSCMKRYVAGAYSGKRQKVVVLIGQSA
jgi:hypothetical protein